MVSTQYEHFLHFDIDRNLIFETRQLIHQYSEMVAIVFPLHPTRALLERERDLVSWQVMGVQHILQINYWRAIRYVGKCYLSDDMHMSYVTAWAAQIYL